MCTALLPPGDNRIAVNKYLVYINCVDDRLVYRFGWNWFRPNLHTRRSPT